MCAPFKKPVRFRAVPLVTMLGGLFERGRQDFQEPFYTRLLRYGSTISPLQDRVTCQHASTVPTESLVAS